MVAALMLLATHVSFAQDVTPTPVEDAAFRSLEVGVYSPFEFRDESLFVAIPYVGGYFVYEGADLGAEVGAGANLNGSEGGVYFVSFFKAPVLREKLKDVRILGMEPSLWGGLGFRGYGVVRELATQPFTLEVGGQIGISLVGDKATLLAQYCAGAFSENVEGVTQQVGYAGYLFLGAQFSLGNRWYISPQYLNYSNGNANYCGLTVGRVLK